MTDVAAAENAPKTADRPIGAGYWPARVEDPAVSAGRLLGLMSAIDGLYPDAGPWENGTDPAGGLLPTDSDAIAELFAQYTRSERLPEHLSGAVVRQGAVAVHFTLGSTIPNSSDNVLVYPRDRRGGLEIVTGIVRNFEPAWAVFGIRRLRRAQHPTRTSVLVPWLGEVTYLPGSHGAPEGAVAEPFGAGTMIDFTKDGTVEPDDATILAAVDHVLPRTG